MRNVGHAGRPILMLLFGDSPRIGLNSVSMAGEMRVAGKRICLVCHDDAWSVWFQASCQNHGTVRRSRSGCRGCSHLGGRVGEGPLTWITSHPSLPTCNLLPLLWCLASESRLMLCYDECR